MLRLLDHFWSWLLRLLRGDCPGISVAFHDDEPEHLAASILYVIGSREHPWKSILVCPCGCQGVIELNLSPPGPPLQRITALQGKRVTLRPSVWRTTGCRSHLWKRSGEIQWCDVATAGPATDGA